MHINVNYSSNRNVRDIRIYKSLRVSFEVIDQTNPWLDNDNTVFGDTAINVMQTASG